MFALRYHTHGSPAEVLRYEDLGSGPALQPGQVRLRLLAAPINPADLNIIQGNYGIHPDLPSTGGLEGCGEVVESSSPDFVPGDHSMFLRAAGSWASESIADANLLFKLPAEIDPLQGAMLRVNPATAWRLLTGFASLSPGSTIIQNAANSAVGRCVIALARQLGIRTINLVRREQLIAELRSLGADEVYLDADDQLPDLTEEKRPALAFNAVGGESALRLLKLLKPHGIHITYGAMARRPLSVPARSLIFDDIQIRGLWVTRWLQEAEPSGIRETYTRLAQWVVDGTLSVPVDSVHTLADFPVALARLEAKDRTGKVMLVPS